MFAIGEAARQSGVGIEAIRYYEREGIVPKPARTASGRRTYSAAAIARLRFVRRCRNLGFSISDIRALMSLAPGDGHSCAKARELGQWHLDDVRHKIAELRQMESALADMMANCSQGHPHCPMLDRLRSE